MTLNIKSKAYSFIPEKLHESIIREIKRGVRHWTDQWIDTETHDILFTIESVCETDAQRAFLTRWAVGEEISHIVHNQRHHEWEIVTNGQDPESLDLLDLKDNTDKTLVFVKPIARDNLSPDFLIVNRYIEYVWQTQKAGYDRQLCVNELAVVITPNVVRQNNASIARRKGIEEAYRLAGYGIVTLNPKDVLYGAAECVEKVNARFIGQMTPENTKRWDVNHYRVIGENQTSKMESESNPVYPGYSQADVPISQA